jgi:hypothetical protein
LELLRDAVRTVSFLKITDQNEPLQEHLIEVLNDTAPIDDKAFHQRH